MPKLKRIRIVWSYSGEIIPPEEEYEYELPDDEYELESELPDKSTGIMDSVLAWIAGGRKGPYIEPLDSIEKRVMWRQNHGYPQLLVDMMTLFKRLRDLGGK